jgi:hypothetical protein
LSHSLLNKSINSINLPVSFQILAMDGHAAIRGNQS